MIWKSLLTFSLIFYMQATFAQMMVVKGNVLDHKTQSSVSGVTIRVGAQSTRTDKEGSFELNVPLKTITELGISFSHIGYLSMNLIYQPNHFYKVQLTENSTSLKEVIVGIKGEDIIKKAIKEIPGNYPDMPTTIKGILRIQKWRNLSQYFKSDAIIQAYVPPYTSSEKTTVTVLSNQLDTIHDETLKYIRNISSYNLVEFADIAHNKEVIKKLLKKRKFDYQLVGKQLYNSHKVFVINSVLLDSNEKYSRLEATFYIDTASYAFVATNLIYYNIPKLGPFIGRKEVMHRVGYERIGKKWYLSEAHLKSIGNYKNEEPHSSVDFVRTELDTVNAEKISYTDIVQNMDDIFLVDKTNNKEWAKYGNFFKEAESSGKIETIPVQKLDTIRKNNLLAKQDYVKPFGRKIYDYIRGGNIRSTFALVKLPMSISSSLYDVPKSIVYGLDLGSNYRIYKSMFIGLQLQYNVSNRKKIGISTLGINLSNEFIFNKNARNIILTPHLGINTITTKIENQKVRSPILDYGLRASYELSHKSALFIASSFNSASGSNQINHFNIKTSPSTVGIGIVLKN